MSTICPRCDRNVRIPPAPLGASVRCPACRKMFVVTTADSGGPRKSSTPYIVLGVAAAGVVLLGGLAACVAAVVLFSRSAAPVTTGAVAGAPPRVQRPDWQPPPVVVDPLAPKPVAARPLAAIDPKRSAPNARLAGKVETGTGITATRLAIDAGTIAGDIEWAADGSAFFVLSTHGTLDRVSYPGFVVEQRLNIGRTPGAVAVSKAGVLVAVKAAEEVWVIDPKTLEVTARISTPGATSVASSPTLGFAFALNPGDGYHGYGAAATYLDLAEKKAVHAIPVPTMHACVTPGGEYYFAADHSSIHRFRIDGNRLKDLKKIDWIADNGQRLCLSRDGGRISYPSGGGNRGAGSYATFVYSTEELKATATLKSGAYPRAVGYDPADGKFYAQDHDHALIVFDKTATTQRAHTAAGKGNEVRQFAVHPKGNRLLVVARDRVVFVELTPDP